MREGIMVRSAGGPVWHAAEGNLRERPAGLHDGIQAGVRLQRPYLQQRLHTPGNESRLASCRRVQERRAEGELSEPGAERFARHPGYRREAGLQEAMTGGVQE